MGFLTLIPAKVTSMGRIERLKKGNVPANRLCVLPFLHGYHSFDEPVSLKSDLALPSGPLPFTWI